MNLIEPDEITEFYYNEFGKLADAPLLTAKEKKKMKNILTKRLFSSLDFAIFRDKIEAKTDKVRLKEFKTDFENKHKVGIWTKIKAPFVKMIGKKGDKPSIQIDVGLPTKSVDVLSLLALPELRQDGDSSGQERSEEEQQENTQEKD